MNNFDFFPFYKKYINKYPRLPSDNFLYWFIGFTEARASFIVKNRGELVFIITGSINDIKILRKIQETLGFGKVIPQSVGASRYKYVVQSKEEIEILISLFNGNIILPTKQEKLHLFIKGFNSWVNKGRIKLEAVNFKYSFTLPNLNNSWLVGFTDGKGCFIYLMKYKSYSYCIRQRGKNNLGILELICSLFKVSEVFLIKDVCKYRINGVKNCSSILSYFDKYDLLTNKFQCYILWKGEILCESDLIYILFIKRISYEKITYYI